MNKKVLKSITIMFAFLLIAVVGFISINGEKTYQNTSKTFSVLGYYEHPKDQNVDYGDAATFEMIGVEETQKIKWYLRTKVNDKISADMISKDSGDYKQKSQISDITYNDDGTINFTVKDGEALYIKGLTKGDEYVHQVKFSYTASKDCFNVSLRKESNDTDNKIEQAQSSYDSKFKAEYDGIFINNSCSPSETLTVNNFSITTYKDTDTGLTGDKLTVSPTQNPNLYKDGNQFYCTYYSDRDLLTSEPALLTINGSAPEPDISSDISPGGSQNSEANKTPNNEIKEVVNVPNTAAARSFSMIMIAILSTALGLVIYYSQLLKEEEIKERS